MFNLHYRSANKQMKWRTRVTVQRIQGETFEVLVYTLLFYECNYFKDVRMKMICFYYWYYSIDDCSFK